MPTTWFAPAKINLHLHIVGRRPDGYHLLDSLVAFAGVGDRLSVTPSATLSLSITGPFADGLAEEPDNLVLRAARALADWIDVPATGHIVLEKNLPVASGIGGGSADAAATLRLMMAHWRVQRPLPEIVPLALRLGADVPACLMGSPVRLSGIGDVLEPAGCLPEAGIVLVNPRIPLATPAVFKARSGPFSAAPAYPAAGWSSVPALVDWLRAARNDLEPAALRLVPQIGDVLDALSALPGCLLARMSGSGATSFGIFETAAAAAAAASGIRRSDWWTWGGALLRKAAI